MKIDTGGQSYNVASSATGNTALGLGIAGTALGLMNENRCGNNGGLIGGKVEDKPYYNSYALCVVANSIYSDMALSISIDLGYKTPNEVPNEKMALSCYRKACELLKDVDGGFRIIKYFKGKMYDNSPM